MCIVDFVQLFQLNLSNNKFDQKIPKEIGRITQLNVLDLSYNLLVVDIPPQLANLKVLVNLNLSHNGISGLIPRELETLTGLQDVVLSYNELEGPIPNSKAFINASLEGNKGLCGNVAGLDPCQMPSYVVKKHSMAKGRILILITVLPAMGALILLCVFVVVLFMCDKRRRVGDVERWDDGWLSITMLDGKALYRDILNGTEEFDAKLCIRHERHGSVYKIDLPSLGNIAVKRLHSSFQNTHPKSFMNEVRALTGIKHGNIVNLYGYCSNAQNSFLVYDSLVSSPAIGNLTNLVYLDLSINQITGSIPITLAFGIHPELQFIDLSDKVFHGALSNNWGKCENLIDLRVARNNISGSIPPEIGNVKGILGLDLSSNHLIGQIPKEFGKLRSLVNLFLQNNRISGNIPEELGLLTKLESLDLSDIRLNGSIPMCIVDFVQLFQLNLSNKFGQKIPKEIGRITQLNVLDLSYNLLVGGIPPQLANLKVLVNLNLSHNGLSGRIPRELETLTGLQDVVLSYNELEGPIPNNKAFINASLEGNKGLCGNVAGLDPCEMSSSVVKIYSMAKGRKLILITVLPVMGALILLCVFVVVLVLCDKRRRVRDVERRDDGWLSITMLDGKTLYRDILNATEEFDAKFCIRHGGHGSVYTINLPSLGNIAVKRLHSSFQNTHPKSFMNEVRALTGIKHGNIVNLYGYCSNAQNSFCVYEYVERGSLSSILSNEVVSKKLDWLKRVNIIKGVAFCFVLHALGLVTTDCSRDISSSNVLLDSEYETCVAYFRIAKILKPDSTNHTALAGTYGYVAPGKF
uniref:non-specific serine/threonine protein kinase n=1 Tax=Solanum tuberosum TaxID=4113 RepID=M1BI07_SOLTU